MNVFRRQVWGEGGREGVMFVFLYQQMPNLLLRDHFGDRTTSTCRHFQLQLLLDFVNPFFQFCSLL